MFDFILKAVFKYADKDKDGYLSAAEISAVLNNPKFSVDPKYAQMIIKQLEGKGGDGKLSFDEARGFLKHLSSNKEK